MGLQAHHGALECMRLQPRALRLAGYTNPGNALVDPLPLGNSLQNICLVARTMKICDRNRETQPVSVAGRNGQMRGGPPSKLWGETVRMGLNAVLSVD
jgi:hypothetical protein